MPEALKGNVTRSRVGGIRMNSAILRTLCKASRNAHDENGDPMKVTSWIRETALADARVVVESVEAGKVRKLNLRVRMRHQDRELLQRAAELIGMPYSTFMLRSAEARAAREAATPILTLNRGTGSPTAMPRRAQAR